MRVLVGHNFYGSTAPSGEDVVYGQESALLEQNGVQVIRFEKHSDTLATANAFELARVAARASWSRPVYAELRALLRRSRPDVAHFHNLFPLISVAAYRACKDERVAVVQTVHNHRYACAAGTLLRAGRPCELCVGKLPVAALVHRCYRGSLGATAAVVRMQLLNRYVHRAAADVDRFVALTRFAERRLVASGVARERITIKGNFLPGRVAVGDGNGGYALFVGRLGVEKGLHTLLDAWRLLGARAPRLMIVGDGPLRPALAERVARDGLNLEICGRQDREAILEHMRGARLLLVPSLSYEGFPLVIAEALACGTPIVASRLGSLEELVADGVTGAQFTPGSAADLARVVAELWDQPDRLARMRGAARAVYERGLTAEHHLRQLLAIYDQAARHAATVN